MIVTLAGGVGAAKFLRGLIRVRPQQDLTAVVNVADDTILHGLNVSPDLDTVTYTLAGAINPETGWGLADESWQAMDSVERYGGLSWFRLGDRDLGTHLFRTDRLHQGATLAEVTREICAAWNLDIAIVPASNDRVETRVTIVDEGEVGFQEYFVRRQHAVPIEAVRFDGIDDAKPTPGVLSTIDEAEAIVIAPSNPIVSIGPVLGIPGIRPALQAKRSSTIAISPIIDGAALKGPADRMLTELGFEATVVGVAKLYADVASTLVIDTADQALAADVEQAGMRCVVAPTIMRTPEVAGELAERVLEEVTR